LKICRFIEGNYKLHNKGAYNSKIRAHGYEPQCREFKSLLVEYQGELEVSAMGVLQGNVISPLIANFTLDGLKKE
jgi:hypothetical protein